MYVVVYGEIKLVSSTPARGTRLSGIVGPGSIVVTLRAAKLQIASRLILAPEHFSRMLHELVDAGLLRVEGRKITVPDPDRLQRVVRRR